MFYINEEIFTFCLRKVWFGGQGQHRRLAENRLCKNILFTQNKPVDSMNKNILFMILQTLASYIEVLRIVSKKHLVRILVACLKRRKKDHLTKVGIEHSTYVRYRPDLVARIKNPCGKEILVNYEL